jgi:hypothetical protein
MLNQKFAISAFIFLFSFLSSFQILANQVTYTFYPIADTFLTGYEQLNSNNGLATNLRIQHPPRYSHAILKFSRSDIVNAIGTKQIVSANLKLYIETNFNNWGSGSNVNVHRMTADWQEYISGTPPQGATWTCSVDTNLDNSNPNCTTQWNGGSYDANILSSVLHQNNQIGWKIFDVKSDVQAIQSGSNHYGWLLRKPSTSNNGSVDYTSIQGPAAYKPKLEVIVENASPTITASISPQPNQYGWNKANVTVTFTCSDPDGIASCTSPQVVQSETAGTIVTGTAQDTLGATSTLNVTVKLDKTVPTLSANLIPNSNQYGWNNTNVLIDFAATDNLSGIDQPPQDFTITTEGVDQPRTATAVDRAGNTAWLTQTASIDKTSPSVSIISPEDNAIIPDLQLLVNGTVSDALSGVQDLTCNGLAGEFVVGTFSCALLLAQGNNPIIVFASDQAGNSSTDNISVESQPSICNHGEVAGVSPSNISLGSPTTITVTGSNLDSVVRVTLDGGDIEYSIQDPQNVTFDAEFDTDGNHQVLLFADCSSDPFGSGIFASGSPVTEFSLFAIRRVGIGAGFISTAQPFAVFDSSLALLPNAVTLDETTDLVVRWTMTGTPTIDPGNPNFTLGPFLTYIQRPFDLIELPGPEGNKAIYIRLHLEQPFDAILPDGSNLPNDRYEIHVDASLLQHVPHIPGLMGQSCEFQYQDATELAATNGVALPTLSVLAETNRLVDNTTEETELLNNRCLSEINCGTPFTFDLDSSQTDEQGYRYSFYRQHLDSVPVEDGFVQLKVDTISGVTEITYSTKANAIVSLTPAFAEIEAVQVAQNHLAQSNAFVDQPVGSLNIHVKDDGSYALSYIVASSDPSLSLSGSTYVVVDATTAAVIEEFVDPEMFPDEPINGINVPDGCNDYSSNETVNGGDLQRKGKALNFNNAASRFFGFSEYYPVTKNGFDINEYTSNVAPFVNFQRIWAIGTSNTFSGNDCTNPPAFTETMPFKKLAGGKFDLSQFDNTYFSRLTTMLQQAKDKGLIVELTLFDAVALWDKTSYAKSIWHPKRNITWPACGEGVDPNACLQSGSGARGFPEFYNEGLRAIQFAYVGKVLDVASQFDNVFIEIMNEARISGVDLTKFRTWHEQIAELVHKKGLLVSANPFGSALGQNPNDYECDVYKHKTLSSEVDIITLHFGQWSLSKVGDPQRALTQWNSRFYKPVIIDDDGAQCCRSNTNVITWAKPVRDYSPLGQAHYNSKGEIVPKCLNCDLLRGDGVQNPPASIDAFEDLPKVPGGVVRDDCPESGGGGGGAPNPPTLLSPANGNWTGLTPLLKWNTVNGADNYTLQVIPVTGGEPVFTKTATQNTTEQVPSGKLFENINYKWRVKACAGQNCSAWSTERTFTVKLKVDVNLGTTNITNGLYPNNPEPGDGETFATNVVGVNLRENYGDTSGHGANDRYFYFKVDDKFIKDSKDGAGQDQKSVQIKIRYYDHRETGWETNTLCLFYDSISAGGSKMHPSCVTVGTTNTMKTYTWTITNDVYFGGRISSQADFRIKTGNDSPPKTRRYIDTVTVTKQ